MKTIMRSGMVIVFLLALIVVIAPKTVFAEDWIYSPAREIESVFPQGNDTTGTFVFVLEGAQIPSSTSCTNRFTISQDNAVYDELVAAVFLAHALGSEVLVYFDDDATSCNAPVRRVRAYSP